MSSATVIEIPVNEITPDPENLRKEFDNDDIQALAENLKEHGQLDPIQVFRTSDGKYDLLDGERRWRAAQLAGLGFLKGIVVARPSSTELLCKKISRFMQTRSLSFPEEVRALEEGLRTLGVYTKPGEWGAAAKKLGVTSSVLRERMRITKLTPELRKKFEVGELDYSVSQTIGKIDDSRLQTKIAAFVEEEELSNRFAVLRFIPAVLENPKRSLMESYEIANRRSDNLYAVPRKKEEVPREVKDRIDEMLEDFRRSLRWLEEAGRQDLIEFLHPQHFNTRRVVTTARHLYGMLGAFLSAYQAQYGAVAKPRKEGQMLETAKNLLKEAELLDKD